MIETKIKFRHLRCFLTVARSGSVSVAANSLALSQPAVTKTLKELEDLLGSQLLTRDRSGARLTIHGEAFLPRAAACLLELERAVESVSNVSSQIEWRVNVGAMPSVETGLLPAAIKLFQQDGPSATIKVVTGQILQLLDLLRAEELDLIVGHMPAPEHMAALSFEPLYAEPYRFVVRPGHPLATLNPCDTERLKAYELLVPQSESVASAHVERLLIATGLAGKVPRRIQSVAPAFGRAFVLDTDIIWVIGQGVVGRDLANGDLVALAIDTSHYSNHVGLIRKSEAAFKPGVDVMIRAIVSALRHQRRHA